MTTTTPDGVSILTSRPGCHYLPDAATKRSSFKPGEAVEARTDVGRPIMLTIHGAHKAREWWTKTERGNWAILRAERPNSHAQMARMNGAARVYRRDKLGRFA